MNGKATGDLDADRVIGINLELGIHAIKNIVDGKIYKSRGIDFFNWATEILPHGLSANASIELVEWESITIKEKDVKLPNLTENERRVWINEGPESCDDQGFFYYDEDEDRDDEY